LVAILVSAAAFGAESNVRLADAAMSGDKATVRSLIQQKVDVNAPADDGTTALHWAVRSDDLETVDLLIRAGANVKIADRYGVTPLYLACTNGNASIIRKLLEAGADANAAVSGGETALMTAAHTGVADAVKVLLDRGADVNAKDADAGQTALMYAIRENHPEAVQLLLARGADVKIRTKVVDQPPPEAGNLQGIARAQLLPKGVAEGGMTPILFAAREGHPEIAKMLVKAGADVNQAEAFGGTPLIVASINGHIDFAKVLVESGANVNAADGFGRTPLWSVVDVRNLDADTRADRKSEADNDRGAALDLVKALLAHGANPNVALKTEPPSRRWMMPFGANQWVSPIGQTPFMRAALAGDIAVMRALLEKGADPNAKSVAGITGLIASAGAGWVQNQTYTESKESSLEAVKLCVEKGADINAAMTNGVTAMHAAALRGLDDVIAFLAQKGAKLDAKDSQGGTPLTYAEGVRLGGQPEEKPTTVALIKKLMGEPKVAATATAVTGSQR
jgi:ankyrin repeat protein